tara:strand:+ start:7674 stop:8138 length:465 start_codon:yes stop_codon:yes gene_type:complete
MNKRNRTDKSRYKHESTGDHCTCAAYVAEIMCKRNAEKKNQGSLPHKFWSKKPWDWTFKRQLFVANKLLKTYSEEALVKAINSNEFYGIFSLNHPKVTSVIAKYELLLEKQRSKPKQEIEVKKNAKNRKKSYGKKNNILNKLRKIENGQEEEEI